jgi:hypothetical protein
MQNSSCDTRRECPPKTPLRPLPPPHRHLRPLPYLLHSPSLSMIVPPPNPTPHSCPTGPPISNSGQTQPFRPRRVVRALATSLPVFPRALFRGRPITMSKHKRGILPTLCGGPQQGQLLSILIRLRPRATQLRSTLWTPLRAVMAVQQTKSLRSAPTGQVRRAS